VSGWPFWLWLNLLSLDAPLIALVWQDFLARCFRLSLFPAGRIALGLTVWAIYLADRLLDIRHPACPAEGVRHRFYRDHRPAAQALLSAVLCADLLVACFWLRPAVVNRGLIVSAGVSVYLGAFSLVRADTDDLKKMADLKKPFAGLLFTAGTFLTASTAMHSGLLLAWPAAAFCALCLGNLLLIEHWVHGRNIVRIAVAMAILSGVCLVVGPVRGPWFAAVGISAAALVALACSRHKLSRDARCVLADAVLLSPLLFR